MVDCAVEILALLRQAFLLGQQHPKLAFGLISYLAGCLAKLLELKCVTERTKSRDPSFSVSKLDEV